MLCSKCGKEKAEWIDLCQECWECYCSKQWCKTHGGTIEPEGESDGE